MVEERISCHENLIRNKISRTYLVQSLFFDKYLSNQRKDNNLCVNVMKNGCKSTSSMVQVRI